MEIVGLPKIGWRTWDKRNGLRKCGRELPTESVLHSPSAGSLVVSPM